jgi:hypothetical protein
MRELINLIRECSGYGKGTHNERGEYIIKGVIIYWIDGDYSNMEEYFSTEEANKYKLNAIKKEQGEQAETELRVNRLLNQIDKLNLDLFKEKIFSNHLQIEILKVVEKFTNTDRSDSIKKLIMRGKDLEMDFLNYKESNEK